MLLQRDQTTCTHNGSQEIVKHTTTRNYRIYKEHGISIMLVAYSVPYSDGISLPPSFRSGHNYNCRKDPQLNGLYEVFAALSRFNVGLILCRQVQKGLELGQVLGGHVPLLSASPLALQAALRTPRVDKRLKDSSQWRFAWDSIGSHDER